MKLNEALKMVHGIQEIPKDFTIRFWDAANEYKDVMIPTTVNIDLLYHDWYGECNHCPENGEFVYGIEINQESTGKVYLIESPWRDFSFEDLMMLIEKEFYKRKQI